MSLLEQASEAKLTPEEIQELVSLLEGVMPKIESKVKGSKSVNTILNNLKGNLGVEMTEVKSENTSEIEKGFKLLKSARTKLEKLNKILKDIAS